MTNLAMLPLREGEPVDLAALILTALILEIYLETFSVIYLEEAEAAGQAMAL